MYVSVYAIHTPVDTPVYMYVYFIKPSLAPACIQLLQVQI